MMYNIIKSFTNLAKIITAQNYVKRDFQRTGVNMYIEHWKTSAITNHICMHPLIKWEHSAPSRSLQD